MIRIIANNGKTHLLGWHDEYHAVKVFKACYALNALYGAGSHTLEFDKAHDRIRQNTLKMLAPVLMKKEAELIKINKYQNMGEESPNKNLYFTGFNELMVGDYDFDLMGHSYAAVSFEHIIELMLEFGL